MTDQPHLFPPPQATCQTIGCTSHASVRVHLDYGATGPGIPALLCPACANRHQSGDELPIRYDPSTAPWPEGF